MILLRKVAPCAILAFSSLPLVAATVDATWNYPRDIPVSASSFTATGDSLNLTLNCVPTGNELTVVNNTGPGFIDGTFSNLAQGQAVTLTFNSVNYEFVANYYGGSGNDLVLQPSGSRALGWGANTFGQLGDDTKTQRSAPVPVSSGGVLSGKTVIRLAAGGNHALALCSDGTVAAWGLNTDGELGNDSTVPMKVPALVNTTAGVSALDGKNVVSVAAGDLHSVALCADGTVATWGSNYNGQLGNGSTADRLVPVAVSTGAGSALDGKTVTAIAAGQSHTLALCSDGTVATWGFNANGELGNNSTTDSSVPVAVDASGVLAGRTVVAVAAGGSHSLALCSDGALVAWGSNAYGQLGNNSTNHSLLPILVNAASGVSALAGKTVTAISAGQYHSLALCTDGSVAAWGFNAQGQLGDGTSTQRLVPTAVERGGGSALTGKAVVRVQAGRLHSVAHCTDGSVVAWGWNGNGQLGDGTLTPRSIPVAVNGATLAGGERFVGVTTGSVASHTLGLAAPVPAAAPIIAIEQPLGASLSDGGTVDFGSWIVGNPVPLTFTIRNRGTFALTGLTITNSGTHSTDYVVTASPAAPLAAGRTTTFTVLFTPAAVGVRTAEVQVASNDPAQASFTIHLSGTGTATGGVSIVYDSPTDIPITANGYTATGNTIGFTLNAEPDANQLMVINNTGIDFIEGTFSNLAQGQDVTLTHNGITYNLVANYYGGTGNDLVLVWKNTRVVAWGNNSHGELGRGTTSPIRSELLSGVEAEVDSALFGQTIVAVATGINHSLALRSDGIVVGWGENSVGQLGTNDAVNRLIPVEVDSGPGSALFGKFVISIAAGHVHSMALCSDGTIAAWGANGSGRVGDGSIETRFRPVAVDTGVGSALNGRSVAAIAAGGSSSFALCSDGSLVSWGSNSGTLVPKLQDGGVLSGKTVVSMAGGWNHALALCSDGTLGAWLFNGYGALGNNSTTDSPVPVLVNTDSGVSALHGKTITALAGGTYHSLALSSDGSVTSWGRNSEGQLGDNSTIQRQVPVLVDATTGDSALLGKTVVNIAAGLLHSIALCSDGTIATWGMNSERQLGDNSSSNRSRPVGVVASPLLFGERFTGIPGSSSAEHTLALVSFPARPLLTAMPASDVTTVGATLNAIVNANGNSHSVSFEFGETISQASHRQCRMRGEP